MAQQQSSWGSQSSHTQALSPEILGQATNFIEQLLAGGTAEQRGEAARKVQVIDYISNLLQNYTTQKGFEDASGLMASQLRKTLESTQPGMIRAVEGAGAQGGSMQALLLNDLATRSAEQAAALGAKQAADYGQITANLNSVLGKLAEPSNIVATTLANAIAATKGTYADSSESHGSSSSSWSDGGSGGSRGGSGSGGSSYSNGMGGNSGGMSGDSWGSGYVDQYEGGYSYPSTSYNDYSYDSGGTIYSSTDGTSSNYGPWYTNPDFGSYDSGNSSYWDSGASSDSYYQGYEDSGGQVYPDYNSYDYGQSSDYTGGGWDGY